MSNGNKLLLFVLVLFIAVLVCVYIGAACEPGTCRVCEFLTGEYIDMKSITDRIKL